MRDHNFFPAYFRLRLLAESSSHTIPSPTSQHSQLPLVDHAPAKPVAALHERSDATLHAIRHFFSRLASLLRSFFLTLVHGIAFCFSGFIHLIVVIASFVYYHAFLLSLPSHYSPRVQDLSDDVRLAESDVPRPWDEAGDAVDAVRIHWQAFHKSLLKEWELMAGACGVICA